MFKNSCRLSENDYGDTSVPRTPTARFFLSEEAYMDNEPSHRVSASD